MTRTPVPEDKTLIRVGLIGYGYAGKTFHAPLIRATPGFRITAVASSDPAKVRADLADVPVTGDAFQLAAREDIDLVVIASPNDTHRPFAEAALLAGHHVVVDKPFTLTLADARALITLAQAEQRHLAVFQNRRWDSDFLGVKQVMQSGLIGPVRHFESHIDRFRPAVRRRWREAAGPGAGLWFDLGPHLVDQALQLFGLPDRIQADFAAQRPGAEVEDWAHVVLDFGAARVILHGGMLAAGGSHRFILHGEKGSLVKRAPDRQEEQLRAGMLPGSAGWGEDPDDLLMFDGNGVSRPIPAPAGDQRQFYAGFRKTLLGNAPNPVPPYQALAVMAVLEAAAAAAQTGVAASLPLTQDERAAWILEPV
jgi:predicted dehydrogenase